MMKASGGRGDDARVDPPIFSPGDPTRVMPWTFDELSTGLPLHKTVLFDVFRADQAAAHEAELEAERERRALLDWGGFLAAVSLEEPDAQSLDAAGLEQQAQESAQQLAAKQRIAESVARASAAGWTAPVANVRFQLEQGVLPRFPTAAEYKAWSDERIEALRTDPEELPDGVPFGWLGYDQGAYEPPAFDPAYCEEDETVDAHPANLAVEQVEVAQRELRQAEANRVQSALRAWRVAQSTVTGTRDAAINGTYFKSVMMQLAHSLQVAERTGTTMLHTAEELETKLPTTWAHFVAGDVPWHGMQKVHAAIEGLDEQYWAAFDAKAAKAVMKTAMPKLKKRLREIRERIQATTAPERHRRALKTMNVTVEPLADGMAAVIHVMPAPEAVSIIRRLDVAAEEAAAVEGETKSIAELRSHVLLDVIDEGLFRGATPDVEGLAVPGRRGVQCKVGLLIPAMTALGHSDVPAVLEGYGPIDIDTAKRLAGNATSWIKVLTDPITGAVKDIGRDKYRPTADMRALLGVLDGGGRGPNCTRPPGQTEADHIEPFNQGLARGRTALDNLVLLSRRDHDIKTSGDWDIELRNDRVLAWTSFMGTRIITTVEPLEPTPVPEAFLHPPVPGTADRADPGWADPGWADPETPDDLDVPF